MSSASSKTLMIPLPLIVAEQPDEYPVDIFFNCDKKFLLKVSNI